MPKRNVAGGGGGATTFATFTGTDVVVVLPATSRATALTVCEPSDTVVEFQLAEYGELVSAAPTGEPSTLNCTLETASLSNASAARATEGPETVAPDDGAVRNTVGALLSTTTGIAAVLETPLLFVAT